MEGREAKAYDALSVWPSNQFQITFAASQGLDLRREACEF